MAQTQKTKTLRKKQKTIFWGPPALPPIVPKILLLLFFCFFEAFLVSGPGAQARARARALARRAQMQKPKKTLKKQKNYLLGTTSPLPHSPQKIILFVFLVSSKLFWFLAPEPRPGLGFPTGSH
jgi:hypothetical protein